MFYYSRLLKFDYWHFRVICQEEIFWKFLYKSYRNYIAGADMPNINFFYVSHLCWQSSCGISYANYGVFLLCLISLICLSKQVKSNFKKISPCGLELIYAHTYTQGIKFLQSNRLAKGASTDNDDNDHGNNTIHDRIGFFGISAKNINLINCITTESSQNIIQHIYLYWWIY